MTDANAVMKRAMNDTLGDHEKGAPIASLTAKYTPKFRRNPRTVAIVSPAAIGFCLVLMGGTEYIPPRNQPTMYSLNKSNGKKLKLNRLVMYVENIRSVIEKGIESKVIQRMHGCMHARPVVSCNAYVTILPLKLTLTTVQQFRQSRQLPMQTSWTSLH